MTFEEVPMGTTYRDMDRSELGSNATQADLDAFRLACRRRQEETGEADPEVTDWMWGNGDYLPRLYQYVREAEYVPQG